MGGDKSWIEVKRKIEKAFHTKPGGGDGETNTQNTKKKKKKKKTKRSGDNLVHNSGEGGRDRGGGGNLGEGTAKKKEAHVVGN